MGVLKVGFRFRRSINLGGGFKINLSGSGIGYSWGVKGFRITKTSKGATRMTASIPGTGISYVEETGCKKPLQVMNKENCAQYVNAKVSNEKNFNVDETLVNAIKCILKEGFASTSLLQRRLNVGYVQAANLIDKMEQLKIVGPFNGSQPREVLIHQDQLESIVKSSSSNGGVVNMERLKLIGQMNRVLLVKDDTIKFIDFGGFLSSMKKEKYLSVGDVTSVEVKKPDLYPGYIQFQISGQMAPNIAGHGARYVSFVSAATDENSVTFVGEDNYQIALAMQRHIHAYNASNKSSVVVSTVSEADEILKYKNLLDGGIITQEEFDTKKKALLSR